MLRIGSKQELVLRKSENNFSKDLLKGLALALSFHLVLVIGLRVASPSTHDHLAPITPVAVEIDLGAPQVVLPFPNQVARAPIEQIEPPQLPAIPLPILRVEIPEYHKSSPPNFSEIEKISYEILEDVEDD